MTFRIYKKFKSMNRFKPIMTFSKLLRNNIIHQKTRVLTFVAVVCLKRFSTALYL